MANPMAGRICYDLRVRDAICSGVESTMNKQRCRFPPGATATATGLDTLAAVTAKAVPKRTAVDAGAGRGNPIAVSTHSS